MAERLTDVELLGEVDQQLRRLHIAEKELDRLIGDAAVRGGLLGIIEAQHDPNQLAIDFGNGA